MLDAVKEFQTVFGKAPELSAFAPGRVNLIGEHIDYNGGHVMPCALSMGIYGAIRRREDRNLRFYSLQFPGDGIIEERMDSPVNEKPAGWTKYVRGVLWAFENAGFDAGTGFDLLVGGDLPANAGLSSSAALEVLCARLLRELYFPQAPSEPSFLPLLAQKAENEYVGMHCGIMDQYASANGKKGYALYLNCDTLECGYTPLSLEGHKIIITNTNKPHKLAGSAYNDRRADCTRALTVLQKERPELTALCAMTPEEFEAGRRLLMDDAHARMRAQHAVYEEARVTKAFQVLQEGKLDVFGGLMLASHESLRDLYEVSCMELDMLVDLAMDYDGVLGSRMTGGGFGGCTVTLLKEEAAPGFMKEVGEKYTERTGLIPSFYEADPGDGVHLL